MRNQRKTKTRNQMRREAIKTAIATVLLIVVFAALTVWTIGVWAEHPGEQFVDGQTYMASLQNGGYDR